jgi:alkaline phosphatase
MSTYVWLPVIVKFLAGVDVLVLTRLPVKKKLLLLSLSFTILLLSFTGCAPRKDYRLKSDLHPKATNIIFMVPDGMGLAGVTAARIFKNGPNGQGLHMETLSTIGYQRTHSANRATTDSAATASAWASGEKFRNGEISCHDDNRDGKCEPTPAPTILELARERGKSAGLVVTSTVTHATPAAFGAHVPRRGCENEIARQYIQVTGVEVILGGGAAKFNAPKANVDACGTFGDFIAAARTRGYEVVYTKDAMEEAVSRGTKKLLGLFARNGKTPELFRVFPEEHYRVDEPTLPQMTAAALEILEKDQDGFFLLVEGSQIDWAGHDNNLPYQISETLAFDEAVKVVLDWINEEQRRKLDTLVIIAPDHETGGFAIRGARQENYKPGDLVKDAWTTKKHTAGDVVIWSQGPGSRFLGRAVDNTDLYQIMRDVL